MKFLIGKKLEMSQVFKDDGTVVPVTYIQAGPCVVTDIRTEEKDGYTAVQLGYGKTRHVAKPQRARAELHGPVAMTHECRVDDVGGVNIGDIWTVSIFEAGDNLDVCGKSKGKGFAGVVKRHGFHGQSATHGTKDQERASGSIGSQGPQRVLKGVRMGGRMGGKSVTVKNLEVVAVDTEKNILAIRGAVPGARNGLVYITGRKEKTNWR